MSTKATITHKGAILLGKNIACDAPEKSKPLRIVTHAHADHMIGLRQSLKTCEKVLMTKATKDLIDAMRGPLFLMSGFVETLDYNKTLQYKGEQITFLHADHILGAAQVLVEDEDGTRIVYTGDFRIDETPILDTDLLVIEATYGNPSCRRSFEKDIKDLLVSTVESGLKYGTVYIFGYHGKLQEVMQILHEANIKAPFIIPEKVLNISRTCEQHGMRLGRLTLSEEKDVKEMLERNMPCVVFYHMGSRNKVPKSSFRIYVSGWEFNSPCRKIADKEYIVALSDHSDFEGLIEYVRRSKPKFVIVDNFRVGYAETLVREIRKHFDISAVALPKK